MQLTADAFAVFSAWSGRTIALATDRFSSSLDDLKFGVMRIGVLELSTGVIRPLLESEPHAKQVNPQWAPDGSAVYFVSDRGGISNVYRFEPGGGKLRQVTNVTGGVSGITASSPSLAVASSSGTLAFSVYRNGSYEIHTLEGRRAAQSLLLNAPSEPAVVEDEEREPPTGRERLLEDARTGLPTRGDSGRKL